MKAFSQDLRERILRAVDQGRPKAENVQILGASLATIKRYLRQRRNEGHVKPRAIPGRPPTKRAHLEAGLTTRLQIHTYMLTPCWNNTVTCCLSKYLNLTQVC